MNPSDTALDKYSVAVDELTALAEAAQQSLLLCDAARPDAGTGESAFAMGAEQLRSFAARVRAKLFTVTVVGEFSTGKSSLLNVLLGFAQADKYGKPAGMLPTDIRATTAAITFLIHDDVETPRIDVRMRDGNEYDDRPASELQRFGAITHSGNAKHDPSTTVEEVTVRCASPFLGRWMRFADTPGLGSVVPEHRVVTTRFVPQSDAVLFLLSSTSPMTESEKAFLQLVAGHTPHFFFVQTKTDSAERPDRGRDGVSRPQWEQTRLHNTTQIREVLGDKAPLRYFPVSSKKAATGAEETSGIPELKDALTAFLAGERAVNRLADAAPRFANLLLGAERGATAQLALLVAEPVSVAQSSERTDAAQLARDFLDDKEKAAWQELQAALEDRRPMIVSAIGRAIASTVNRLGGAENMIKGGIGKIIGKPQIDEEKLAELTRAIVREAQNQMRTQWEPSITATLSIFTGNAEEALRLFQDKQVNAAAKALVRSLRDMPALETPPLAFDLGDILLAETVTRTETREESNSIGAVGGSAIGGGLGIGLALFGGPLGWIAAGAMALAGAIAGNEHDRKNKRTVTETISETKVRLDSDATHHQAQQIAERLFDAVTADARKRLHKIADTATASIEAFEVETVRLQKSQAAAQKQSQEAQNRWRDTLTKHQDTLRDLREKKLAAWKARHVAATGASA